MKHKASTTNSKGRPMERLNGVPKDRHTRLFSPSILVAAYPATICDSQVVARLMWEESRMGHGSPVTGHRS